MANSERDLGRQIDEPMQLREIDPLAPHLGSSERLHQSSRDADRISRIGLASLDVLPIGIVICDAAGRVVFANRVALAFNRRIDGLQFHSGRGTSAEPVLTATDSTTTMRLQRSILNATARKAGDERGTTLRLPRSSSPVALIAVVTALPQSSAFETPLAMVLVSDPLAIDPGYEQRAQLAFSLTPAEARLADALVRGLSRAEFAQAVRVKASTVKTQMKALFAKTETRRESELMRILLALPRLAPSR